VGRADFLSLLCGALEEMEKDASEREGEANEE